MSATTDTRAAAMMWTKPFARFETQTQARTAAQAGVVAAIFPAIGLVVIFLRFLGLARNAATASVRLNAEIEVCVDAALLALLVTAAYTLVKRQSVWASWVMAAAAVLQLLGLLQRGHIGAMTMPMVMIVMWTILSVRGAMANRRFVDKLDCF